MSDKMYNLKLTEQQARIVSVACEFYARVRMGQFNEIIMNCLDLSRDDFCERRDAAETQLLEARKNIYPELHGIGHSYGIGKFEDADRAFDVHQILRNSLGTCDRPPFSYYDLPVCEVETMEKQK